MPITTGTMFSGSENFNLSKAVLIYEGKHDNAYATIHDVNIGRDGQASLLAGVPATREATARIARDLIKGLRLGSFLPANVLSVGIDSLVWWVPTQKRLVYFKSDELGGERSAETCHPGLVFRASANSWHIFAVKGNSRPTPDTQLFQAPYFNVWKQDGKICTGNVTIPGTTVEDSIKAWTDAFFDSYFTHPNVHAPDKLVNWKGGSYAFWRSMLDGEHKKFPEKALVSANMTIASLLKQG